MATVGVKGLNRVFATPDVYWNRKLRTKLDKQKWRHIKI